MPEPDELPEHNEDFYKPEGTYGQNIWAPWTGYGEFGKIYDHEVLDRTVVSPDRLYVLYALLKQTRCIPGEIWECGVFRGGSALLMARCIESFDEPKTLRLFDTFAGMPEVEHYADQHKEGEFAATCVDEVRGLFKPFPWATLHDGFIPDTFGDLGGSVIAMAHIDVDIYKSVRDCCEFIWDRLSLGGYLIFDDYGFWPTKGSKIAVDEFFASKLEFPLVLPTGQAIVSKCP